MRNKIISFCITCKNRFRQIKRTLPRNLKDNYNHKSIIDFVLIDFNSSDGLKEWILTNFKKELKLKYLKYFYTNELVHWHASIAKNTAHLYASGEILVNLDCDNYTGRNGGYFLLNCFNNYPYPIVIHQFSGDPYDGSYGRISVRRDDFYKIGGYNERFAPMGYQDADLITRLVNSCNVRYKRVRNLKFNSAIENSKELGIRYCNSQMNYLEMNKHNMNMSNNNIANGKLVANDGTFGINKHIYNHKELEVFPTSLL